MVKHIDEYEAVFGEHEQPAPAGRRNRHRAQASDEDVEYDEVTGARGGRRKLDLLNKKRISKYELDELFCEF